MDEASEKDAIYKERNACVLFIAKLLKAQGYAVWLRGDPLDEWQIILMDSPAGQLSWHITRDEAVVFSRIARYENHDSTRRWDGHTTADKYERMNKLLRHTWIKDA